MAVGAYTPSPAAAGTSPKGREALFPSVNATLLTYFFNGGVMYQFL